MRDAGADPSRAVERANRDLARHQHVRRWHVWPETDFPRTPTQKVRKRDILDALTEDRDGETKGRGDVVSKTEEASDLDAVALSPRLPLALSPRLL